MKPIAWRMLGVLILLAILVFIWPTRYRYDHTDLKGIGRVPVRIDRLTGNAQVLHDARWQSSDATAQELPRTALSHIEETQLQAGSTHQYDSETGAFALSIYNGSDWTVRELSVEIRPKQGSKSRRIYVLTPDADARPHTSGRFTAEVGQEMETQRRGVSTDPFVAAVEEMPRLTFRIIGARGYRR